jgi:hypothetical protein
LGTYVDNQYGVGIGWQPGNGFNILFSTLISSYLTLPAKEADFHSGRGAQFHFKQVIKSQPNMHRHMMILAE